MIFHSKLYVYDIPSSTSAAFPPAPGFAAASAASAASGRALDLARAPNFKASDFLAAPWGIQRMDQLIGLREKLQEHPIFHGKIMEHLWFPVDFPLSQPIDTTDGSKKVIQTYGPNMIMMDGIQKTVMTKIDPKDVFCVMCGVVACTIMQVLNADAARSDRKTLLKYSVGVAMP